MTPNYKMITALVLLAIVMFVTGSVVINMYNRCSDAVKKDVGFHWWVGLLSILGGLSAIVLSVLAGVYADRMDTPRESEPDEQISRFKQSLQEELGDQCNVDALMADNRDACAGKKYKKTMLQIHSDKNRSCPILAGDVTKQCTAINEAANR